jgi:hypothetical protein
LAITLDVFDVEGLVAVAHIAGERQRRTALCHEIGRPVGSRLRFVDGFPGLRLGFFELVEFCRERRQLRLERLDVGALREHRCRRDGRRATEGARHGQGK